MQRDAPAGADVCVRRPHGDGRASGAEATNDGRAEGPKSSARLSATLTILAVDVYG
jgi:hypothetical protein